MDENEINKAGLNAAVHMAPEFVIDLGNEEEWEASEATNAHDMRFRLRNEHMEYFCKTCEDAARERQEG